MRLACSRLRTCAPFVDGAGAAAAESFLVSLWVQHQDAHDREGNGFQLP